jgi:histidine triad (HIT) family protein
MAPAHQDFYCDSVLSGRVPVTIVAETDSVLAFHHTSPAWETHIVVIPKQHVRSLVDAESTLVAELFQTVVRIIKEQKFDQSNFKVVTNGGTYQSTEHLHVHLVSGRPLNPDNPFQAGELML